MRLLFNRSINVTLAWATLAVALVLFSTWLTIVSPEFGYNIALVDMPILPLVLALVGAGIIYALVLPPLIRASGYYAPKNTRPYLAIIVLSGLAARIILIFSDPILEQDYQRYFWDGAVTVHGINPYKYAPKDITEQLIRDRELLKLKAESGYVFDRIAYQHLTTIYPPVAQVAFAIARVIEPWSIKAWRSVVLLIDMIIVAMLLWLLIHLAKSPLWVSLYWWNPLVLKELFNSAHMDGIVVLFLLLCVVAVAVSRGVTGAVALALAAGAKFWPLILTPVILRRGLSDKRKIIIALGVMALVCVTWATPMVLGGLDQGAGLVAYSQKWQLNSPLFSGLNAAVLTILQTIGFTSILDNLSQIISRILVAAIVAAVAIVVAIPSVKDTRDLIKRLLLVTATLLFLAPAAYPWYVVWLLPFLVVHPWTSLLLLTPLMELYYLRFYYAGLDDYRSFNAHIVLIIWTPIWIACLFEFARSRSSPMLKNRTN